MTTWLAVAAFAVAGLMLADTLLLHAEARGWIYYRRRRGSPGTSAAAALTMQAFFQPAAQSAVQLVDREAVRREDDQEGDRPLGEHR
jgi:hypothetical protein